MALANVAPNSRSKLSRTLIARAGLVERWIADAARVRDRARPLVWFHAPSVGEGLQARPIIEALRRARPDVQIAYSFFSPSAESFAQSLHADIANYLPFDSEADAQAIVDALAPTALFFVKLDVWPKLVSVAKRNGVTVGLLSGTVAPASSRQGKLSRAILHDAYAALDIVGAIDAANGARLCGLGVAQDRLGVSGDTRFDQVWKRAEGVDRNSTLLRCVQSDRQTVVAGSTWPADEAVLLAAWATVKERVAQVRLIIAPHEPTPEHLLPILDWARERKLSVALLRELVELGAAAADTPTPAAAETESGIASVAPATTMAPTTSTAPVTSAVAPSVAATAAQSATATRSTPAPAATIPSTSEPANSATTTAAIASSTIAPTTAIASAGTTKSSALPTTPEAAPASFIAASIVPATAGTASSTTVPTTAVASTATTTTGPALPTTSEAAPAPSTATTIVPATAESTAAPTTAIGSTATTKGPALLTTPEAAPAPSTATSIVHATAAIASSTTAPTTAIASTGTTKSSALPTTPEAAPAPSSATSIVHAKAAIASSTTVPTTAVASTATTTTTTTTGPALPTTPEAAPAPSTATTIVAAAAIATASPGPAPAPAPAPNRANANSNSNALSDSSNVDVVVVDRVGVLGDLYALADVAFVGGAFHKAGLHSVLEPAAYGVPVVFGPAYAMSREAGLLLQQDGARTITTREECAAVIVELLSNNDARTRSGARARTYVQSELGAAERSLELVLRALA